MYKIWWAMIWFLPLFLFADQASAFVVSPARYLITADPNTVQTVQLSVKNDEQESKKFKIFVVGVKQSESGALVFEKDLDVAEAWVRADQPTVVLVSEAQAKINFIISVPKNASPGSHYLGLAVESMADGESGSVLGGRLFSILTLRVAGEVVESVSVDKWSGPMASWRRDWPMSVQLKNNGNIDVSLKSVVDIKYQGKILNTSEWPLGNILLINSVRYLDKTISFSPVWPGRYEVQNKISYGRSGQVVWATYYVWYFPIWSIVSVVLMFLFFIFVYIKLRHRHVQI